MPPEREDRCVDGSAHLWWAGAQYGPWYGPLATKGAYIRTSIGSGAGGGR